MENKNKPLTKNILVIFIKKGLKSPSDNHATIPTGEAQVENDHLQIDASIGSIKDR